MDNCKHCTIRGDFSECVNTKCNTHDSWYVKALISKLDLMTKEFLYLTDCNLATVSGMARIKSRAVREYERQILIAQKCVDVLVCLSVDPPNTRVKDVINDFNGSVQEWADARDIKNEILVLR